MRSLVLSFTALTALVVTPAIAQTAAPPSGPPGPVMPAPGMNGPGMNGPGMNGPATPPVYGADQGAAQGTPSMGYANGGMMGEMPAPPSHQPRSRRATNINGQDTRSKISPSLPSAEVGPNADASQYLRAARGALSQGRTGAAQEALENAETYLLNRSVAASAVNQPDQNPAVTNINSALQALGAGDRAQAMNLIDQTIPMTMQAAADGMGAGGSAGMMHGTMMGPPGGVAGGQPGMMNGGYPPPPPPNNPPAR